MDRNNRPMLRTALGLALLPGFFGLVGCSGEGTLPPSKTEGGKSRDERQKSREFGTLKDGVVGEGDMSKAVPSKRGSR